MAITWLTPSDLGITTTGSWTDVDVSASVPAGATGVILHIVNNSSSDAASGFRKNGSTDDRYSNVYAGGHFWAAIGVDSSRIFEAYIGSTDIDFYLVGYFSSDAVFFTNATDKSLSSTSTWTDIDISSDTGTDTALAAIWEVRNGGASNGNYGFRKNGSTDTLTRAIMSASNAHCAAIIGVDESEICEGYAGNTNIDFFLVGYIIANVTMNTNATNLSLSTTGAWTDLSALSSGATGGFINVNPTGTGTYYYGFRKNGSSEDIYKGLKNHYFAMVECDTSQLIEGKIGNTDIDFYLVGYATAASGGAVPVNGTCSTSTSITGSVHVARKITGAINAATSLSANLKRATPITGAINVVTSLAGNLTSVAMVYITGAINAITSLGGDIKRATKLSGAINTTTAVSGSIKRASKLSGAINAVTSLSANIRKIVPVSGAINAATSLTGSVKKITRISSAVNAVTSLTGDLTQGSFLTGAIGVVTSLTGNLHVARKINGAINVITSISGFFFTGSEVMTPQYTYYTTAKSGTSDDDYITRTFYPSRTTTFYS